MSRQLEAVFYGAKCLRMRRMETSPADFFSSRAGGINFSAINSRRSFCNRSGCGVSGSLSGGRFVSVERAGAQPKTAGAASKAYVIECCSWFRTSDFVSSVPRFKSTLQSSHSLVAKVQMNKKLQIKVKGAGMQEKVRRSGNKW